VPNQHHREPTYVLLKLLVYRQPEKLAIDLIMIEVHAKNVLV